jgi:dihydroneopterin aldolase
MRFRIEVLGLRFFGFHGVLQHEKDYGQQFEVDCRIEVEVSGEDEISKTLSYADVANLLEASFNAERHDLLETLSARLRAGVMSMSEQILSCEISVHKPSAPLTQEFSDVIVTALGDR